MRARAADRTVGRRSDRKGKVMLSAVEPMQAPLAGSLAGDCGLADADVAGRSAKRSSGRSDAPGGDLESAAKLRDAVDWLRALLERGPLESKEVARLAAAGGFRWRTVQRAKERTGVAVAREGFGRGARYVWTLEAMRAKPDSCMPTAFCLPTEPAAPCVPTAPSVPLGPCVPTDLPDSCVPTATCLPSEPCAPSQKAGTHEAHGPEALSESDREAFDERAGILEFDAGMEREQAEAEARRLLTLAIGRRAR
jgi:hypothetical protein